MAKDLVRIDLTGGAVITRSRYTLQANEVVSAGGCRFAVGDPVQLYRDLGTTPHSAVAPGFVDAQYLSFENAEDLLVASRRILDGSGITRIQLETVPATTTTENEWEVLVTDPLEAPGSKVQIPEQLGAIHRGDEYFVGTGGRSYLFRQVDNELELVEMGMRYPDDYAKGWLYEQSDAWEVIAPNHDPLYTHEAKNRRMATLEEVGIVTSTAQVEYAPLTANGLADNVTWPPSWPTDFNTETGGMTAYHNVYYITEYDEVSDVESLPLAMLPVVWRARWSGAVSDPGAFQSPNEYRLRFISNQEKAPFNENWRINIENLYFDFSGYQKRNPRATHVRIYRQFIDSYTLGTSEVTKQQDARRTAGALWGDSFRFRYGANLGPSAERVLAQSDTRGFPLGNLQEQVDLADTSEVVTVTPRNWAASPDGPQTQYWNAVDLLQTPPKAWTTGALFSNQLVTNIVDQPTVLQYSAIGLPEYFPRTNYIPLSSDGEDRILSIYNMDRFLLVTTPGGIHRVNYLPSVSDPDRAPTDLISTDGCVGHRASCKVTLPQGTALVWLSEAQLNMTTGSGGVNPCEDWSVAAAGLDRGRLREAVLVNNTFAQRLELYVARQGDTQRNYRYDFYYSRLHMKGTGFKMLGPTAVPSVRTAVNATSADRSSPMWLLKDNGEVLNANQGINTEDMEIELARLYIPGAPHARVSVHRALLQHTTFEPGKRGLFLRIAGKDHGHPPNAPKLVTFPNSGYDEIDVVDVRNASGNHMDITLTFDAPGEMVLSPLWLEVEVSADGR